MAIVVPQGFEVQSKQPIDSRILLTKEQMLSINDNIMPVKYFVICVDDGKLYLYDKNRPTDPEVGRFKEVTADISGDISTIEGQIEALNTEIADKQDKFVPGKGIELVQDSQGNLVLNSIIDPDELAVEIPAALRATLSGQDEVSGLEVDEDGNISVSLDETYLKVNDSNKITFTDFIIQSI